LTAESLHSLNQSICTFDDFSIADDDSYFDRQSSVFDLEETKTERSFWLPNHQNQDYEGFSDDETDDTLLDQ